MDNIEQSSQVFQDYVDKYIKGQKMKYYKRLNMYKASNVTFNPETKQAYSYGWWRFVDEVNGFVIFNNATYSSTTSRHQYKVSYLLRDNSIAISLVLNETRKSLCSGISACILDEIRILSSVGRNLMIQTTKKGTRKVKNQERFEEATDLLKRCDILLKRGIEEFEMYDLDIQDAKKHIDELSAYFSPLYLETRKVG